MQSHAVSRHAVIVDAIRTPLGRRNGRLSSVTPPQLLAGVLKALVGRTGLDAAKLDDVMVGCVTQIGDQSGNIGRAAALYAGYPTSVPATTIQRACGSSQQALNFAMAMVQSGAADAIVAAGVEHMTRHPLGSAEGPEVGFRYPKELLETYPIPSQGVAAELVAAKWNLSRASLDEIALRSHQLATQAIREGRFEAEIVPVVVDGTEMTVDEGVRQNASAEALAKLAPVFQAGGCITAGNSSQISDGAAAVLVMEEERALREGLTPRARLVAQDVIGVDPVLMLTGPLAATRRVLDKAGLRCQDIDLFEINEAFASVIGMWLKEIDAPLEKVNVNGGAIALGHPIGATGVRLVATLLNELERRDARYGLISMCCGGGIGTATIIERLT